MAFDADYTKGVFYYLVSEVFLLIKAMTFFEIKDVATYSRG